MQTTDMPKAVAKPCEFCGKRTVHLIGEAPICYLCQMNLDNEPEPEE